MVPQAQVCFHKNSTIVIPQQPRYAPFDMENVYAIFEKLKLIMIFKSLPFTVEENWQVLVNHKNKGATANVQSVWKSSPLDHVKCLLAGHFPIELNLVFKPTCVKES